MQPRPANTQHILNIKVNSISQQAAYLNIGSRKPEIRYDVAIEVAFVGQFIAALNIDQL